MFVHVCVWGLEKCCRGCAVAMSYTLFQKKVDTVVPENYKVVVADQYRGQSGQGLISAMGKGVKPIGTVNYHFF